MVIDYIILLIYALAMVAIALYTKKPNDTILYEAFDKSFEGEIQ